MAYIELNEIDVGALAVSIWTFDEEVQGSIPGRIDLGNDLF